MITVEEARNSVRLNSLRLNSVKIAIEYSEGYVLAKDIYSTMSIPSFPQSSMDGFAIRLNNSEEVLPIQDELPAGSSKKLCLLNHFAIKVFTGGQVPEGADLVIQKEWVNYVEGGISVQQKQLENGANIRLPGSEIKKDELAIPAGIVLNSFQIAFLASMGITTIEVYRKPKVSLIITGNELIKPGEPLEEGKVYESNSFGLKACLQKEGIDQVSIFYAQDNLVDTEEKIQQALKVSDLVLLTGGVSVGDYDFVAKACVNQGVSILFHGVKQKPGKPLFLGSIGSQLIFGLPGNPASVLSCFQQYVLLAINQFTGKKEECPIFAKLNEPYEKKNSLCFFLKGYYKEGVVCILSQQASFQLSAFAKANCWIEMDEKKESFEALQLVRIHMFH